MNLKKFSLEDVHQNWINRLFVLILASGGLLILIGYILFSS